jgi:hypothetical protein
VDSQFVFRCNLHPVTRTGWSSNRRVRSGGVRIWDDPATDQFLSVDPDVAETGQPYAFTGDDPLNATDPLGLIKYRIQEFGEGFTKVVDIKKERYEHVNVHVKQLGITKKQYYNALLETLRLRYTSRTRGITPSSIPDRWSWLNRMRLGKRSRF